MSRKSRIAVLVAIITLLCTTALLATDTTMGIAQKQTLTLTQPTVVGGTLLPAGDYNVTHEMQGQTHIMTFKQIGGNAEVKTKCNLVPLTKKATRNEQVFKEDAQNQRVLLEMTFRGDAATHVLAQ